LTASSSVRRKWRAAVVWKAYRDISVKILYTTNGKDLLHVKAHWELVKEPRKVLCGEEVKKLRPHWETLHKDLQDRL
jgi:hypothetical protein